MRIIRYREGASFKLAALTDAEEIFSLEEPDFISLVQRAAQDGISVTEKVKRIIESSQALNKEIHQLDLIVPLEAPEIWAAGVTYMRSKEARNDEAADGDRQGPTYYDKVYEADRPELFMKSTAARTAGPGGEVCLRSDSSWQVPEPELGLVLDRNGSILGYTIGNDMSCRDIEGENPLYLPQAKIWRQSCSIGPAIRLADTVEDPYDLQISCRIYRGGKKVVDETASTSQLKRGLGELVAYLAKDNILFDGTVLLTGTCIVPPGQFTLEPGDRIEIDITGIGTLTNIAVPA
ncbi:fumarylacetoacetate hydrolase family protein [Paenibacillus harenae]|uniref:fumarylacetoacetate hydrolase family protein n=1 Tax=Paenibacillus harenae TaxID=306543 RepID=UPI00278E3CD1|nr:fumarylacetoacetate hydrolase family protein [Paenibacillus harenae]MDQ0063796.1 2-dehydro-3-deoxy-D-arabinonate dehydratase [Paenibacillus harenae]